MQPSKVSLHPRVIPREDMLARFVAENLLLTVYLLMKTFVDEDLQLEL